MRASIFRVIDERDTDCFALSDDYQTASHAAREAARERPTETILITYKGWVIRHLHLAPDGRVAEEEISRPEAVDRAILALRP